MENASVRQIRGDLERAKRDREEISREITQLEGELRQAQDLARSASEEARRMQSDLETQRSRRDRDSSSDAASKMIELGERLRQAEFETCGFYDRKIGIEHKLRDARNSLQAFAQHVENLERALAQAQREAAEEERRSQSSSSPWSGSSSKSWPSR